jgi:hypothetical protein
MPSPPAERPPRVAILLSTYNGAAFLPEQLDSIVAQSHPDWTVYWRDDGSGDASVRLMRDFAAGAGAQKCVEVGGLAGHHGVLRSYLHLLREVEPLLGEADAVAFADQDDVWLPEKLLRGRAGLDTVSTHLPALYCTQLVLVAQDLRRIGTSPRWRRPGGFPAALTQNLAPGCSILLNRAAARLVAVSAPPPGTLHDWWSYLLVAAAGGRVLRDETPTVLYRQHHDNAVGMPASKIRRAIAALARGPHGFMTLLRQHVAALLARPDLLSDSARGQLGQIDCALRARNRLRRVALLTLPGFSRQAPLEDLLFRLWVIIG